MSGTIKSLAGIRELKEKNTILYWARNITYLSSLKMFQHKNSVFVTGKRYEKKINNKNMLKIRK